MKSFLTFLLILFLSSILFAQWVEQPPLTLQTNFNCVTFFDQNNGIGVGDYSSIFTTTDGGKNWEGGTRKYWESLFVRYGIKFNSIFVYKYDTYEGYSGFAVGNNGLIVNLKTRRMQKSNTTMNLHSVFFTSNQTGYCVGNAGTILKTTDEGKKWNKLNLPTQYNFHSIHFVDENTGFAAGGDNLTKKGVIFKTTNAGTTWNVQFNGKANDYLYSVNFKNKNYGWACGYNGTILKTTNGGIRWFKVQTNETSHLNSIKFNDYKNGIAVGNHGTILISSDGGYHWKKFNTKVKNNLNSVFVHNKTNATIVGDNGTVLSSRLPNNQNIQPVKEISWVDYVQFLSKETGFVKSGGLIYKTTDQGKSWKWKNTDDNNFALTDKVFFADSKNGWLISKNLIYKTTNGGETWSKVFQHYGADDIFDFISSLYFIDKDNGWAVTASEWFNTIYYTSNGGKTWESIGGIDDRVPTYPAKIYFNNKNEGFIVGSRQTEPVSSKVFLQTKDGGKTWKKSEIIYPGDYMEYTILKDITFADEKNGFAVGNFNDIGMYEYERDIYQGGMILRTTDGGETWVRKDYGIRGEELNAVSFPTSTTGFIVGHETIMATTDGGETWKFQNPGVAECELNSVHFTDAENGWAVGRDDNWHGLILKYDKDVKPIPFDWSAKITFTNNEENYDNKNLFFGQSKYATDGIDEYQGEVALPSPVPNVFDVRFKLPVTPAIYSFIDKRNIEENEVTWNINIQYDKFPLKINWVVPRVIDENNDEIYLTDGIDGSYLNIKMRDTSELVFETKPQFNTMKIIYKRNQSLNKSLASENILQDQTLLPKEFALHQNYPNPFNPNTKIKFDLPEPSNVVLSVYNILGERVTELINNQMDAGFHEINFNANNLPSGIYIYRIDTEKNHTAKKMLLVK